MIICIFAKGNIFICRQQHLLTKGKEAMGVVERPFRIAASDYKNLSNLG